MSLRSVGRISRDQADEGTMKRVALVTIAVLCLNVSAASAGLDLTWNTCNTSPGAASDITLPCSDPAGVADLYGCFQVPRSLPDVVAWQFWLDFQFDDPGVPPFWNYVDGCGTGGLGTGTSWCSEVPGIGFEPQAR